MTITISATLIGSTFFVWAEEEAQRPTFPQTYWIHSILCLLASLVRIFWATIEFPFSLLKRTEFPRRFIKFFKHSIKKIPKSPPATLYVSLGLSANNELFHNTFIQGLNFWNTKVFHILFVILSMMELQCELWHTVFLNHNNWSSGINRQKYCFLYSSVYS